MSVQKLTTVISLAFCLPPLALLALSVYYAGGVTLAIAAMASMAILLQVAAYFVLSNEVAKPINGLALASAGGGGGQAMISGRKLPEEIESIKSYVLSASVLLDEYRERYRGLLMSVPDILFETDRDGRVIFVNRAARELTGYPPGDCCLGRHFLDFIAPDSRERAREAFDSILEGKAANNVEIKVLLGSGAESFFDFNAVPLWKDGAVAGCCCVGRNIDERRKIITELEAARRHAEEATAKLKKTVSDLEEFSLLAVRRELKMQELREMFVRLKEEHEINKEFPG